MRSFLLVLLGMTALTASGCAPEKGDYLHLDWTPGQVFFVETSYRVGNEKTEEGAVDLDGTETRTFAETWSEPVVWSYQVVEQGYVPGSDDRLHDYAVAGDGTVVPLSVLRASVDTTLNDDPALLEADPVVYLVFREDRDRLAGLVSFTNVDGDRREQAWSSSDLSKSWSALSQSNLGLVPTFLAPWGAGWGDETLTLENGSKVETSTYDESSTDAVFEDEIGGGYVSTRYEAGQPWPTWTVAENLEARLLSDSEATARVRYGRMASAKDADEFDYRAALASSLDIEDALTLDAETVSNRGFSGAAREGYRPWAGSWWKLSEAALVFGYDSRDTLSDRLEADVKPIKSDMDTLSDELRALKSGSDYDKKLEEYNAKQAELVEKLVGFYDGVLADLDGGKLQVKDGKLTHADGWSYDLDELSPMDKMALQNWADGQTSNNPFYLPAWELLNMYNPVGGSWWGHCNGWSGAAILMDEPTTSATSTIKGETVTWTTADQKGLLSESHYSTYSNFYGERYDGDEDDVTDLTPAAFQRIVSHYLRDQEVPLVFDTTATEEVWNFPAWSVEIALEESSSGGNADLVNVNTADLGTLDTLPGIGDSLGGAIIAYREANGAFQSVDDLLLVDGIGDATYEDIKSLVTVSVSDGERTFKMSAAVKFATDGVAETHVDNSETPEGFTETWGYTLKTDSAGLITSGEWDDNNKHPDFAWVPHSNPTTASSSSSENPFLDYASILAITGSELERK